MPIVTYLDLHASVVRFCAGFAAEVRNTGGPDLHVIDFDALVEADMMPEHDLIGPASLGFEADGRNIHLETQIGISTIADRNLFRLRELTSSLFNRLLPDSLIPCVEAETGTPLGVLKVKDGTTVLPVVRNAKQRPLIFILVRAGADLALGP